MKKTTVSLCVGLVLVGSVFQANATPVTGAGSTLPTTVNPNSTQPTNTTTTRRGATNTFGDYPTNNNAQNAQTSQINDVGFSGTATAPTGGNTSVNNQAVTDFFANQTQANPSTQQTQSQSQPPQTVNKPSNNSGGSNAFVTALSIASVMRGVFSNSSTAYKDMAGLIAEASRIGVAQQNASTTELIAGIEKSTAEKQAILDGIETAKEVQKAIKEMTVGDGITHSYTCRLIGENKEQTIREQASRAVADSYVQAEVAQRTPTSRERLAERQARHKGLYCGQAEVKQGSCLYSPKMKPLQNTDFGNFMGYEAMQADEQESALDFIKNVIDPVVNTPDDCDTATCRTLRFKEQEFLSLATSIQGAFTQAIARRSDIDTPMRTLVHQKIQQDPNTLSGDNWKIEQGTMLPNGQEVRGGVGGATNPPVAQNSLLAHKVTFVGDKLADYYFNTVPDGAMENVEKVSKNSPKAVLDYIKGLSIKDEDKDKPMTLVISTAYLEMKDNSERNSISETLENLKGLKARFPNLTVIILGLPDDKPSDNDWLRGETTRAGFSYNGGYKTKKETYPMPDGHTIDNIRGLNLGN